MFAILSIQSHVVYGHVGNSAVVFAFSGSAAKCGRFIRCSSPATPAIPAGEGGRSSRAIDECVAGLEAIGVLSRCDGVVTGYLGGAEIGEAALAAVAAVRAKNPARYACDPVIGDEGAASMCARACEFFRDRAFRRHDRQPQCLRAGVADRPRPSPLARTPSRACTLCERGPKIAFATSLRLEDTPADALDLIVADGEGPWRVRTPKLPIAVNGAGDLFSALFLHHWLDGRDAAGALAIAAARVYAVGRRDRAGGNARACAGGAQAELRRAAAAFRARKVLRLCPDASTRSTFSPTPRSPATRWRWCSTPRLGRRGDAAHRPRVQPVGDRVRPRSEKPSTQRRSASSRRRANCHSPDIRRSGPRCCWRISARATCSAAQDLRVVLEEKIGEVVCVARHRQRRGDGRLFHAAPPARAQARRPRSARSRQGLGLETADIGFARSCPERLRRRRAILFRAYRHARRDGARRPDKTAGARTAAAPYLYCPRNRASGLPLPRAHVRRRLGRQRGPATGSAAAAFAAVVMAFDRPATASTCWSSSRGLRWAGPSLISLGLRNRGRRLASATIGGSAVIVCEGKLHL